MQHEYSIHTSLLAFKPANYQSKGYCNFVPSKMYKTGRKRLYIFRIKIDSQVVVTVSVCLSACP